METYDLHLSQGCSELPDLRDFATTIPTVTYPAFTQMLVMDLPQVIGFLYLDVAKETALALLERLRSKSARGLIINAAYRKPRISPEEAERRAAREVPKVRAANRDIKFDALNFVDVRPTTFDFIVLSEQLAREGYIPSGVYIHVDTLDGHIWHQRDFENWYAESGEEDLTF